MKHVVKELTKAVKESKRDQAISHEAAKQVNDTAKQIKK